MILACPFCKAKADPAAIQCVSCGKTMSRACPACAETIAANSVTCKYCGEAVPVLKEPAPVKSHPGIVFLEERPRRNCCGAGRGMFWILVLALAGFCAYSAVKTKMMCHRLPVQQTAPAPSQNF
ncbi:MAG TPA: zinc ribbon domain-containing protein [Planctomycetota bacterium]|nr:zinc ribbon domain-containing protein [Planctomycetota bacterium]